ncbi:ABC transporter ATP-binding protein [Bacillus sp. UNC438CL73TsuS30]|uniref:ABC transporter ATP-binding protein n=1 Tax=Bacillus sp. UNC438CL73TsuS30 TaxID=1340434 RepID=UPI0004791AB3|nr:ABC transporter ATP-binding protein [Bacillus sp. UNC438CL73TsuS30]
MAFIELNKLTFTYPDCINPAIRNLSLSIDKGQFVVLFGASGSGKSTLLKLLKKEIQPHGTLAGDIFINGKLVQEPSPVTKEIGFVFQDPENQVVADDVLHEMVFGLENIGLPTNEMRSRVAEMVHFFGAEALLEKKTQELSGGKKQQVNLASVLLMQPDILLLDEPTAQLDPVSTREFLDMIKRLNEEFGMTIIMAEHRLEEVLPLADQLVMMESGEVIAKGDPREVLTQVWNSTNRAYVPSIPSLFFYMKGNGMVPLTVKEGRSWIQTGTFFKNTFVPVKNKESRNKLLINAKNILFHYEKKKELILNELDFTLAKGEFYALMGGNGSGKSTFLKLIAGLIKPDSGKVFFETKPLKAWKQKEISKKIGYLPQNPKLFFLQDTVRKEMNYILEQWGFKHDQEVQSLLEVLEITDLLDSHPYDLSGGELQKAALACLLLRKPEVLFLDEPTKGLDPISKENLAKILTDLNLQGITILMSTHDVEFAAQHATKCGMMFQGKITAEGTPEQFFKGNFFYTTMVQRLFRYLPDHHMLTIQEALKCVLQRS